MDIIIVGVDFMNLKKVKMIGVIGILILSFLTHFLYEWFPNPLFAIFFPVNESVWEHMKMLFTTILIYSVIEYLLLYKFKINTNNFMLSSFIIAIIAIPIFLALYLPFHYTIGHNMVITIIIMTITFIIIEIISYKLLNLKPIKYSNFMAILLIIASYIMFGYFTYNPLTYDLFFDPEKQIYGLNFYTL